MHKVYLALGTNLGDRRLNLIEALDRLRAGGHIKIKNLSSLYETGPVGFQNQPLFLNMVAEVDTSFTPLRLLEYVKEIEAELGRQPTLKNGPRPIDIDLLFYDDLVLEQSQLQIPHPRMKGRGFVFVPLAEIAPDLRHPVFSKTAAELLDELEGGTPDVKLYRDQPSLPLPLPRFMFVTGKLAGAWLEEQLKILGEQIGFDYKIAELPIEVAAFMTVSFIANKLVLTLEEQKKLDLIIIPGWAAGELSQIEKACGVIARRGPTDIAALEPFLAEMLQEEWTDEYFKGHGHVTETQLRSLQARLTDSNIRIYTDGTKIYAFNNLVFASGEPEEREIRKIFRQLKIENPNHAFYLGKELYKAALSLKMGKPYLQDREFQG